MILKLWLCTASFLGPIVALNCVGNNTPIPSGCQANNSHFAKDMDVYPPSAVNCSFASNLCCYRQGCFDVDMGNWSATNGYASVTQYHGGCGPESYSILESPWVIFSTPSCVQFAYSRRRPYQLQVFLAFSNGTLPSRMEDSQQVNDNTNHTASFDIEHLTGKIQFRVRGGGGAANVSPPNRLDYVRITEGRCLHNASPQHPEASDPSSCDVLTTTALTTVHTTSSTKTHLSSSSTAAPTTVHTTSSTNTHLTPPSTAAPTTVHTTSSTYTHLSSSSTAASTSSQPTSTSQSTDMTVGDGDSGSNVGVIIGASVAAVAAVVVFVLILIFYRRKVHARKPKEGKRNLMEMSASSEADNPALGPDDPYELAEDGAPGQNRNSCTDDYTYIGTEESSHQTHHQANGTLDDDYSCIGDTQTMATGGVQGMNTAPAKPDPRDVYSVVNKPGKKISTPVNSLAKTVDDKPVLPNPNDVYSVVNKKGKKPDLAPKPGHSDTVYNTISHKANDNSSQKAAGDATTDTYNRIGGVASLGSKGKSQESALAEKGSLGDEYNTLDFADTRQNASRKETSGAARAAYDHVRNDPDDSYSKTQIGKRNVVIGSDYDHVKP